MSICPGRQHGVWHIAHHAGHLFMVIGEGISQFKPPSWGRSRPLAHVNPHPPNGKPRNTFHAAKGLGRHDGRLAYGLPGVQEGNTRRPSLSSLPQMRDVTCPTHVEETRMRGRPFRTSRTISEHRRQEKSSLQWWEGKSHLRGKQQKGGQKHGGITCRPPSLPWGQKEGGEEKKPKGAPLPTTP